MPETENKGQQDPFWERRAIPGKRSGTSGQDKLPGLVTPSQFKQQLLKYCQRQTKHNRSFCLASMRVLEYDQVSKELGPQAGEQLTSLVRDVCDRYLRDADRLCVPAGGRFLVLLPDTDQAGAYKALNRITATVAASKIHHKHKALHASCSLQIASSDQYGSDPEALLEQLGYELDDEGKFKSMESELPAEHHPLPFSGNFEIWFSRYEAEAWNKELVRREELEVPGVIIEQFEAIDTWKTRQPVIIQTLRLGNGNGFTASQLETLHKRARVAQHLNHPCITTVFDYHVKDGAVLYLVHQKLALAEPNMYLEDDEPDTAITLDWLVQLCNALVYLQSLVPPLVPPLLDECLYIDVSQASPAIVDYELPYVLPELYSALEISTQEAEAAAQGRPIAAYKPVIDSLVNFMDAVQSSCRGGCQDLAGLIERLRVQELPKELNTIFKIRAALTEVLDTEKLALITRTERSNA
jgi:diguanylate cyclase (GGDEF)-like protein